MEQAHRAGHDPSTIASIASFFVSRMDTAIDAQLDTMDTLDATELRGRTAIANTRLAYQRYERVFSSHGGSCCKSRVPTRDDHCGRRQE